MAPRAKGRVIVKPEPGTAAERTTSTSTSVNRAFYQVQRSDAPPPSSSDFGNPTPTESTEPAPLLREMRMPVPSPMPPHGNGNAEESFDFHTSFQDIGKKLKACNDVLGELQSLGVSHDVPLPELVLVGDQSAGKSSVMSGLANLDLPRSEGTCTRCPLHIRVSANAEWSCRVSLAKDYKYQPPPEGRPVTKTDVTDENPFYPWKKLPTSRIFEFKTVHDKSEIEEVLRWAQIAILNDDQSHQLFIPGSGAVAGDGSGIATTTTTAKFSPNIVSLEIKGPDMPNLSFYDMPGIFQSPPDARDDYLVKVVRNLSKSYILRPSAIIMCSMPMNSDAENSSTFSFIRDLEAADRTIGVLTKADLLTKSGSYDSWLDIMNGTAHRTGLGYFITSRPQGKNLEELRQWEVQIFENHEHYEWPNDFDAFKDRCSVDRLKAFLSERLGEEFMKSLPLIKRKVKTHLDRITRSLGLLPELPDNIPLRVHQSLSTFTRDADRRVADFAIHFSQVPEAFRDCLLHIKPKFIVRDSSDRPMVVEILDSDSDDNDTESVVAANTPSKRRNMAPPTTPAKRLRTDTPASGGRGVKPEELSFPRPPSPSPSVHSNPAVRSALSPPFDQFASIGKAFRTLAQVREEIEIKAMVGLPEKISDRVIKDLAIEALTPWNRPMDAFLVHTMKLLESELSLSLDQAFDSLKKRLIYKEAKKHLTAFLITHLTQTRESLAKLYSYETNRLLTINNEAFARYQKEEFTQLSRFRHSKRMEAASGEKKVFVEWDRLTEAKQQEDFRRQEMDTKKIGGDKFEREIKVMADVRGYYKLAALRFADNVTQCILCGMIPAISDMLSQFLFEDLGIAQGDTTVYERLMAEDQATASRREIHKAEKEKFLKALASIEGLNTGTAVDGVDDYENGTGPADEQMLDVDEHEDGV